MSLLASLSPVIPATIRTLMRDLETETTKEIYAAIQELRAAGYLISAALIRGSNERGILIDRDGWPVAFSDAMRFSDQD